MTPEQLIEKLRYDNAILLINENGVTGRVAADRNYGSKGGLCVNTVEAYLQENGLLESGQITFFGLGYASASLKTGPQVAALKEIFVHAGLKIHNGLKHKEDDPCLLAIPSEKSAILC